MDTNRLQYFCTIAKTSSITEAAQIHHISVPALSKSMKVLEEEWETKLFQRSGRGILLTEQGKILALKLEPLLRDLTGLLRTPEKIKTSNKNLSIASFEVFTTYFLGQLLESEFQGYSIRSLELTPGRLEGAVANGDADFAITYIPVPYPGVDFLKVCHIEMGIFGLSKFLNKELIELPFAAPLSPLGSTPTKVRGLDGWPDHLKERRIQYHVELMQSALELCRRGLAVAFLPQFIAHLFNRGALENERLRKINLKNSIGLHAKQAVFIVKRKNQEESFEIKKAAKAIRLITQRI